MQKILQGSEVNPTSDGEDRFFAGVFLCFGVALLWCARDLQRRRVYLNFLAAAFFVGGVGRLLSVILVGAPHPWYLAMLLVELVLPPVLVIAAKRVIAPG